MSGDDVVRGDAVHSVFSVMVGALDAINRLGSCSDRRGTRSPYETRYGRCRPGKVAIRAIRTIIVSAMMMMMKKVDKHQHSATHRIRRHDYYFLVGNNLIFLFLFSSCIPLSSPITVGVDYCNNPLDDSIGVGC